MRWHEGDVVRKLRETARWTLRDLAAATGVNVHVIQRIEKGTTSDPRTATLDRIAVAFGLTALDIRRAVPPHFPLVIKLRDMTTPHVEHELKELSELLEQRRKHRRRA